MPKLESAILSRSEEHGDDPEGAGEAPPQQTFAFPGNLGQSCGFRGEWG